jgi:purine-binding chemotaxis protein CheW
LDARPSQHAVELLVFELAAQRYGLRLSCVQEVVRAVAITHLPGAPAVVEGAIDVRGRVVPVLDLRARFGLPRKLLDPDEHLILARGGARLVAIRADRVHWLFDIAAAAIVESARVTPTLAHVAGVARLPDGLVLIHDLETFLTEAEAEALEGALEGGAPPAVGAE